MAVCCVCRVWCHYRCADSQGPRGESEAGSGSERRNSEKWLGVCVTASVCVQKKIPPTIIIIAVPCSSAIFLFFRFFVHSCLPVLSVKRTLVSIFLSLYVGTSIVVPDLS